MRTPTLLPWCAFAAAALTLSLPIAAQPPCPLAWQAGDGIAGLDGPANAMLEWDPDGPGPLPVQIVVGGAFRVAGDRIASNIALYDPAVPAWTPIGNGILAEVTSLLVRSNGRLVAGTKVGAVQEWNGTAWQALGGAQNQVVNSLVELPNGDLVAGGTFWQIAGAPINGLARWDGSQWSALGNPSMPSSIGTIQSMVLLPNGDLVVGGLFSAIGGVACNGVARWNGSLWAPLGAGSMLFASGLVAVANGELLAFGNFPPASGFGYSRWDGSAWNPVPAGVPAGAVPLRAIGADGVLFLGSGGLYVQQPTGWTNLIAWSPATAPRCGLLRANGEALVGGNFTSLNGQISLRVARWNGSQWQPSVAGNAGSITAAAVAPDGSVLVGGTFETLGGVAADGVARFDGTSWSPLGFAADVVGSVVARPDGEVLFAGTFPASPGGVYRLMRWQNGTAVPIPTLAYLYPTAMALAADGSVWVAIYDTNPSTAPASTQLFRWDGTALVPTAIAVDGQVTQLVELPNGDLILGGGFSTATGGTTLLQWDGLQLQAIPGAPLVPGLRLGRAANGDLLVGGQFTAPGQRVARWNGAVWSSLGTTLTGFITSIDALPNGDVLVGERVSLPSPAPFATRIQRWDGVQWSLLGTARGAASVLWSAAGELLAFGDVFEVDGTVSSLLARLSTACPAGVVDRGGGCSGSAGPVLQRVEQRAWLGATMRIATRGVPANAIALGVLGLVPTSVPLVTVSPLGGAGCVLRSTPDVVAVLPVMAGEARTAFVVPNLPSLLGAGFEAQTVVVETGVGGAITLLTTSNGLGLTLGAF
jgi:hypothetical protein